MDVCFLWVLYIVRYRSPRGADHSSRDCGVHEYDVKISIMMRTWFIRGWRAMGRGNSCYFRLIDSIQSLELLRFIYFSSGFITISTVLSLYPCLPCCLLLTILPYTNSARTSLHAMKPATSQQETCRVWILTYLLILAYNGTFNTETSVTMYQTTRCPNPVTSDQLQMV